MINKAFSSTFLSRSVKETVSETMTWFRRNPRTSVFHQHETNARTMVREIDRASKKKIDNNNNNNLSS